MSLTRMGVERLDLLQFHWWDYKNDGYLDALQHLSDLQQEGKIRHLALTNFDGIAKLTDTRTNADDRAALTRHHAA